MTIEAPKFKDITFFGRTFHDKEQGARFFNWTGSGFSLRYTGTKVEMQAVIFEDNYPGEDINLPWIAVFIDDEAEPGKLIKTSAGHNTYTLYSSAQPETHTLRVVKRSENSKGRIGLRKLQIEGEGLPDVPANPQYRLEFIGDSITCGFGGEMDPASTVFSTADENGFGTYSALAARELKASYQSVCISGIPLCWASDPNYRFPLPGHPDFKAPKLNMLEYYEYTDRLHQERQGTCADFEKWNFDLFGPDAIIINLGTNDAFRIRVSGNDPGEEQHFINSYVEFLGLLRRCNGNRAVIACTLGPMDYYLYDAIKKAVNRHRVATGDEHIFCMKFGAMDPWGGGIGGLGHPSGKTHRHMAKELVSALQKWLD